MNEEKNQLPPAEAVAIAGLCDYAPGAVVSRTLHKNKAGNLTLFSFEEGQGLSEHSAPFDALVQIVEGEGELTIGGKLVTARAGELVLMPANIPHSVHARTRFKMLLTMIRG
jgi:quercetin dioxygenase-like cupin family protein